MNLSFPRSPHRRATLLRAAAVAVIATAAGFTIAQQPASQPTPAAQPEGLKPTPEQERAALKARLERRLAESKAMQERFEAALKRLDAGAPTQDVLTSVEPAGRFPRSGPPGPPGDHNGRTRRAGTPGQEPGPSAQPMDRDAILVFMDRHNPEMAARFRSALKDNPAAGERLLARVEPHIRELQAEKDPEIRSLRLSEMQNGWEIMSTGRQLTDSFRKKAADDDQAKIRATLSDLIGRQFDLQVKLHEREIASLEGRITQLRTEMSEQLSKRDSYITERVDQITKFAQDRAARPERDPGHDQNRPGHDDNKQPLKAR